MTVYYAVKSWVDTPYSKLYTYDNLIKALNNYQFKHILEYDTYSDLFSRFYHNDNIDTVLKVDLTDIKPTGKLTIMQNNGIDDYTVTAYSSRDICGFSYLRENQKNVTPMSLSEFRTVQKQAKEWYESESKSVDKYILNYRRQSDLLAVPSAAVVESWNNYRKWYWNHPKSHTSSGFKPYRRVGTGIRTASMKAARKYNSVTTARGLNDIAEQLAEYDSDKNIHYSGYYLKFSHPNRHADDMSYVWDDPPHERSRHSTGWKYSTKDRYQWMHNAKNERNLSQRTKR